MYLSFGIGIFILLELIDVGQLLLPEDVKMSVDIIPSKIVPIIKESLTAIIITKEIKVKIKQTIPRAFLCFKAFVNISLPLQKTMYF